MAFQSPHHVPHCCCCGRPISWLSDGSGSDRLTEQAVGSGSPAVLDSQPTIGVDPATSDATPEPDGGTRLLAPIPNPVCEGCAAAATTADGASIDPPSATDQPSTADSPAEPPATTPASGPNPVVVDGVTCWRIGTDETWQLARDALGCESAAEFLRRHTDDDGRPLRWFGIDHHGSPRQVRIKPDAVSDITAFCASLADGTAVRIETAAGARSIDVPVVDVRRISPADRSAHDPPQVSALTAEATPRRVTVSLPAIETLFVPPQPTVSAPGPEPSSQQLDRYGRLAAAAPGVVDTAGLAKIAQTAAPQTQTTAVRIVASVLSATATPGLTAIPSLVACLDGGRLSRLYALRSLAHIAAVQPAAVADAVDAVIDTLPADSRLVATAATRLLAQVADHDPGVVVDAMSAFDSLLEPTPTRARRQALATVGLVAKTEPDAVRPLVPQLCSLLETDDTAYLISTTAALGRVTAAYPAAATPAVPTLLAQLTADSPELRANTVGILGDIAAEYPTDIAPYTDELAGLLSDDDPTVRSNTAGAFARIAAVRPRHVTPFVDALIELLDDSWTRSRVHACWALGRCNAAAAADALAERRHTDPQESVRQRAAWALDRIT